MTLTPAILKELRFDDFVVLDLETTGLDPTTDWIIEIGAIRFQNGQETEVFSSLINPGMSIPDFITKLTGISDSDVQTAPAIQDKLTPLLDFIADSPLIGHQINFDGAFIEYLLRRQHNDFHLWEVETQRFKYFNNSRLDTLFLARIFLPFLPRFTLGAVAAYFKIDLEKAHRAIEDARASGNIFLQLIERTIACNMQILRQIIRLLYPNSGRVKHFFQPILEYKLKNNIDTTAAGITEDITYVQNYFNVIGEADYQFKPSEYEMEAQPVDEEYIAKYLSKKGALSRALESFEEREQQIQMARAVAQTFNQRQFLIVEAGTGTGKSMAYLLPAVEWAVQNRDSGERILISTNTKNLQEQLFFKDIPTVHSVTDQKFKAVILKGKSNYLCLDKWKTTLTDMDQRLSAQERTRILPLILWAEQTQSGDIAENAGFQLNQNWGLWGKLIAENNYCPGKICKFYADCFLMKTRNHARHADLVVVNHSLLFSDLITDNTILGEYHNLIIDEAHHLEKTAGEYLGVRFNWWTFRNIYHKLYEEEPRQAGTLAQLEYRLNQAKLNGPADRLNRQISRLKTTCSSMKASTQFFFSELNQKLREKFKKEQNGYEESKIRYHHQFRHFKELSARIDDLKTDLTNCRRGLQDLITSFTELPLDSFQFQDQIQRELVSLETDLENLMTSFDFALAADQENYVYWFELPFNKESNDVSFNAVPLNIADLLNKILYNRLQTAVFTSATLAVSDSFEYYQNRVGLDLVKNTRIHTLLLGSPFNYKDQLLLGIPDFLDDPRQTGFTDQLAGIIKDIHQRHPTGMLALFTNYSMLNYIYNQLKVHFEGENILLLAQGKSGSRTSIINQFREYKDSVLFGTDSFWEGIDVPGEALELLLITKLPFDVPSEPLIAAKMEQIKKRGGNPFLEYAVPEAIIKFRQGFGRLIRHKNDFGAVIVCDNRLNRMNYGKDFLSSLPVNAEIFHDKTELFSSLNEWFKQKKNYKARSQNE
jgi:predicted DnaQ family exonuclease/DinG family helicase